MISHAGELFKREILRQVQKGYAVNVLGPRYVVSCSGQCGKEFRYPLDFVYNQRFVVFCKKTFVIVDGRFPRFWVFKVGIRKIRKTGSGKCRFSALAVVYDYLGINFKCKLKFMPKNRFVFYISRYRCTGRCFFSSYFRSFQSDIN